MTVVRDLTDEEYCEGHLLARRLSRLCFGRSTFAIQCIDLAEHRILTRGQLDALKIAVKRQPQLDNKPASKRIRQQPSRRRITLPKQA